MSRSILSYFLQHAKGSCTKALQNYPCALVEEVAEELVEAGAENEDEQVIFIEYETDEALKGEKGKYQASEITKVKKYHKRTANALQDTNADIEVSSCANDYVCMARGRYALLEHRHCTGPELACGVPAHHAFVPELFMQRTSTLR